MDWNWFFSALAQSCAAIVGLMGAFIFTKIVGNQASFRQRRTDYESLEIEAQRLVQELDRRWFEWYNQKTLEDELADLQEILRNEEDLGEPESYLQELDKSVFVERSKLLAEIQFAIDTERSHRHPRGGSSSTSQFRPRVADMRLSHMMMMNGLRPKLEAERERIDRLVVDTRAHSRKIESFVRESRGRPEMSTAILTSICSCLLLFYVGVIYPLGLLPADNFNAATISMSAIPEAVLSFRGLLLGVVTIVFSAVMIGFGYLNSRMLLDEQLLQELEKFANVDMYSSYLASMEDNLARNCSSSPTDD